MNILAIFLLVLCGGLLLTIRSMKNLLTTTQVIQSEIPQLDQAVVAPEPPLIIDTIDEVKLKITEIISHQKHGLLGDIVVEKLFFDNNTTYAVYHPHNATIWSADLPAGFIVEENKPINSSSNILAHQYIIRHKYSDVFYLSKRSVIRKPTEYIVSGIDQMHWHAYLTRQHTAAPHITTGDRIFDQITSEVFSQERRTTS